MVEQLFLAVPWGCLRFVIVVFPDHTHLLFLGLKVALYTNAEKFPYTVLNFYINLSNFSVVVVVVQKYFYPMGLRFVPKYVLFGSSFQLNHQKYIGIYVLKSYFAFLVSSQ